MLNPPHFKQPQFDRYAKTLIQVMGLTAFTLLSPALTKVVLADLASLNKSFSPTTISPGEKSTLKITIFNAANRPLTNVNLTDNMPAIAGGTIKVASPATISNTCGGTVTGAAGSSTIQLTGGTVGAAIGGTPTSCTITVEVSSTTSGTLTNTIPANALQNNENDSNDQGASGNLEVLSIKALTVSNAFSPQTIFTGGNSTYTVTINNPNVGLNQPNTSVNIPLPANVTLNGIPSSNCGGTFTGTSFTGGTIPGATNTTTPGRCVLTFPVTSNTAGSAAITVPANSITTDRGITNPAASGSSTLNVQQSGTDLPLGLSKSFGALAEDGSATLDINLSNPNSIDITGISLTDNLPPGMTILPTAGFPSTTCTPGTVTTTTSSVTLINGTLPKAVTAVGSCKISVKVTTNQPSGTPLINTIPIGAITTTQGISNGTSATATATVAPALVLGKAISPSVILPNVSADLTLTIKNNSTKPATGVQLLDTFPIGLKLFNPVGGSVANCGTPTIAAVADGTSIQISGATIAPGATCTVVRKVTSSDTGGVYVNRILKNTLISDQGWTEKNDRTATLTVQSGFSLSKQFNPSTVTPNTPSILVITLKNDTDNPITGATVTDTLPAGALIAATPDSATSCSTGTVTATPGTNLLKITGASVPSRVAGVAGICTFNAYVVSTTTGPRNNSIGANTSTTNQGLTNIQAATATLTVQAMTVGITKAFTPTDQIDGGDPVTLVVRLSNQNNVPLDNATFTDNMPVGMQVFTTPNPTSTCGGTFTATPGASSFSFTGGLIPAVGNCDIKLQVTSVKSGNLTNTIPPNSVTTLQGATNPQSAGKSLTVLPSIAIQKSFAPTAVNQGQLTTLAIDLLNSNSFALGGAAFTDNFPGGLVVADTPAVTNACGGSVTATPGAGNIILSGGTIPGFSSCRVTVAVKATQAGTLSNTIPPGGLVTSTGLQNKKPTTATVDVTAVANNPNLILLKRITKINNVAIGKAANGSPIDFTTVVPQPDNASTPRDESQDASNPNWVANYPKGAIDGGVIKSGDLIEYTIYFLSTGNTAVKNANICDWVPSNTTFVPDAYGAGKGIELAIGSTVSQLTNVPDSDRGVLYNPGAIVPTTYPNGSTSKLNCMTPTGVDGAVVVNLVNNTLPAPDNQLSNATAAGTPDNSYGFIRFVSKVK
jgi:uncharacterized repeat protein (TIGR01451 family)